MAVRIEKRRGERHVVLDIYWQKPDGTLGRYRRDAEVQTLAAARAEERRRLAAIALTGSPTSTVPIDQARHDATVNGTARKADTVKFADAARDYLALYAPSRLKPSTRSGYECVIATVLVPRFGALPITGITAGQVRELDAELVRAGAKPSTRRNIQAVLRSVLNRYAVEAGLLDAPPALPRLPKVGMNIVSALTREEVTRILGNAKPPHRLAFLLATDAGLRAGEVRGLRWRDVDLRAASLVVRQSICRGVASAPKSGHERIVPLTDALAAALAAARNDAKPLALVSTNARGKPWSEFGLGRAMHRACARAGLDGWRFHDLRHYFVTSLFRTGVSAPTVQMLAGHAELETTQRYAHVAAVDLAEAIRRLNGTVGEGIVGNGVGNR
jgi:integrase